MNNSFYKYEWEMNKFEKIWYVYMPYILMGLALVCSLIDVEMKMVGSDGVNDFSFYGEFATLWGNPNIIAILGVLCIIPCCIVVPKSMLKLRKDGDGLGLMFMPLGLLAIFDVMSTIQNLKDFEFGITVGVIIFIVAALGTFRKTIKLVMPLCLTLMLVSFFLIFAGKMPYCYNYYTLPNSHSTLDAYHYYYVTYFVRDLLLFLAYGILADRIKKVYILIDADKSNFKLYNEFRSKIGK